MPVKYYTEEEYKNEISKANALQYIMGRICEHISSDRNTEDNAAKKTGGYHYIPNIHLKDFMTSLSVIKKDMGKLFECNKTTFLDAGCGIGVITSIAQYLRFKAYGCDIDEEVLSIGNKMFGLGNRLMKKNILRINYKKYDVVYMYCPFNNSDIQKKLELKIAAQIKVGSYIMPAGCGYRFCEMENMEEVKGLFYIPIYKKIRRKAK